MHEDGRAVQAQLGTEIIGQLEATMLCGQHAASQLSERVTYRRVLYHTVWGAGAAVLEQSVVWGQFKVFD